MVNFCYALVNQCNWNLGTLPKGMFWISSTDQQTQWVDSHYTVPWPYIYDSSRHTAATEYNIFKLYGHCYFCARDLWDPVSLTFENVTFHNSTSWMCLRAWLSLVFNSTLNRLKWLLLMGVILGGKASMFTPIFCSGHTVPSLIMAITKTTLG